MQCRNALLLLTVVALSGLTVLNAQQRENRERPGNAASRPAGQLASWQSGDHMMASCVAIANQQEIALARFIQDKLTTDDAQDFAKQMIKDHTDFLKKLERFAPEAARQGFLAREGNEPGRQAQRGRTTRTAAKPNLETGEMPIDLLQLEREVAEQQLDDLEHLLNEKEGVKMDEAFIGFQIAQHAQLASKVKVFERHATSELKDVLSDGLKVIEQHQQHAEKLMKQIAKQASKDLSKEDSK